MWSGPRSISTALMRSFENRPDTIVCDEPFYAHYLNETGEDHPDGKEIILQGETNWDAVVKYITGDIPGGKQVWYQKHMASHIIPGKDLTWISKMHNILLIRHPQEVILSYIKKYKVRNILQLGYSKQTELYAMLTENNVTTPLIIDARDILEDPERMLIELCRRLNIPFYNEMIAWPAGHRKSDGIWGKHWYGQVEASTGFYPDIEKKGEIPSKYKGIFRSCMECYQQLYAHRINNTMVNLRSENDYVSDQ